VCRLMKEFRSVGAAAVLVADRNLAEEAQA
jgi:hypothetical protein